jgi:hypothetical protein
MLGKFFPVAKFRQVWSHCAQDTSQYKKGFSAKNSFEKTSLNENAIHT